MTLMKTRSGHILLQINNSEGKLECKKLNLLGYYFKEISLHIVIVVFLFLNFATAIIINRKKKTEYLMHFSRHIKTLKRMR